MSGLELPVLIPILGKTSMIMFSCYSNWKRKKQLKNSHEEIKLARKDVANGYPSFFLFFVC